MEFKIKVVTFLKKHDITVQHIEQKDDNPSIICHINKSDNAKIAELKDSMEKDLNVILTQSDMFGMNVLIVEDTDFEG